MLIDPGRVDPYGFEKRHDFDSYQEMMDEYAAVLARRSARWSKLLQERPHVEKNVTGRRNKHALISAPCGHVTAEFSSI